MSYPDNRQSGPEIYHYAGNSSLGSYIAPTQPVTIHRTSNLQPVVFNQTSNVQPVNPQSNQNIPPTTIEPANQSNSQFQASRQ